MEIRSKSETVRIRNICWKLYTKLRMNLNLLVISLLCVAFFNVVCAKGMPDAYYRNTN